MPGSNDIDPYEVLGLSPKADDVVIRAAWKALIRKYHPDASTAPDAAERAARINAAFKLLVTAEARRTYDRRRAQPATATQRPAPAPAWPSTGPSRPPPPRPVRRHASRRRKLAIAIPLAGALTLYFAGNETRLPAPAQRAMDGILTDPWIAQARSNARRLLGLDAPPAFAAVPSTTEAGDGPPPPIDKVAIVATLERFVTLSRKGGSAVAAEGRDCIARTRNAPSWAALDNCTTLHIAGLAAGSGLSEEADPNAAYFGEATPLMPEHYAPLSSDDNLVTVPIQAIRTIVWATLFKKYATQVPMRQPRTRTEPPSL